jgi:hypothetical protein
MQQLSLLGEYFLFLRKWTEQHGMKDRGYRRWVTNAACEKIAELLLLPAPVHFRTPKTCLTKRRDESRVVQRSMDSLSVRRNAVSHGVSL